jgi:chemotaxis signal transduction protein
MPLDFANLRAVLDERTREVVARRNEREASLLADRARAIAQRAATVEQPERYGDYVVARRGQARFGVPTERVVEVRPVVVTRVPGATAVVQGLFQVRGRVHALVDALPLFGGHAAAEHGETVVAILLDGRHGRVGLRIDEAVEVRSVAVRDLDSGRRSRGVAFVDRVTTDLVQLLDVDVLFDLPHLMLAGDRAP